MRLNVVVGPRARSAGAASIRTIAAARPLRALAPLSALCALVLAPGQPAFAAPPAACGGVAQISDERGDGHHANSDVVAAWFSEASGGVQAVIQTTFGAWSPAHEDSSSAGFAMLFESGGQLRYVRLVAPRPGEGPLTFDHGAWLPATGFVSAGPTTGEVVAGVSGSVTIDVPAATGAVPGARLARPFVMTYDGGSALAPHWVDRAPGGANEATPTDPAFGADYVVGSCQPAGGGGTGAPGAGAPPGTGATATTTAVVLNAPARLVGGGALRASGRIVPARGDVPVRLTVKPRRKGTAALVRVTATRADGTFAYAFRAVETSLVDAVVEGVNAQTRTVTVRSTVAMKLRRLRDGTTRVSGTVAPRIPGRVQLLRTNAFAPTATTTAVKGRFTFKARRLARGRYEVVFIPSGSRAERSTSKSGAVR